MDDEPGTKRGIAESLRRLLDQRDEQRSESGAKTAVLTHDGLRHVVGLVNLSSSGAMIRFGGDLAEGAEVILQLLDHGAVAGHVRWGHGGQVGISFLTPIDGATDT